MSRACTATSMRAALPAGEGVSLRTLVVRRRERNECVARADGAFLQTGR
jgi:hypothetical protein